MTHSPELPGVLADIVSCSKKRERVADSRQAMGYKQPLASNTKLLPECMPVLAA